MISHISYEYVILSSDVKMKTMQHKKKGYSHVYFLAKEYSQMNAHGEGELSVKHMRFQTLPGA